MSLDHFWSERYAAGDARQTIAGREFLTRFAALARERGDFPWHVAYHPYPEPLTDCRFWSDDKHAPHAPDAAVVSFRNLEVLIDFLARPELTCATPRDASFSRNKASIAASVRKRKTSKPPPMPWPTASSTAIRRSTRSSYIVMSITRRKEDCGWGFGRTKPARSPSPTVSAKCTPSSKRRARRKKHRHSLSRDVVGADAWDVSATNTTGAAQVVPKRP
ncbi:MAG: DUF5722 domain-containing protein [Pirellulales bacterium]